MYTLRLCVFYVCVYSTFVCAVRLCVLYVLCPVRLCVLYVCVCCTFACTLRLSLMYVCVYYTFVCAVCLCVLWTSVNVCPDNISDRSNLVWWCIIISQSIIQKYHFAMFQVKATIVSTTSSEILKLLQSKLVWWFIIIGQGKTPWKDFLAFTQGVRQRIWLGWLWTRLLPLLAIPISKAGVNTGSNQENVERTCFCNEYTCLLSFLVNGSSVWFLHPFVLVMMSA